ncbi:hypothetical protein GCM10010522_64990 [Kribbella solani]
MIPITSMSAPASKVAPSITGPDKIIVPALPYTATAPTPVIRDTSTQWISSPAISARSPHQRRGHGFTPSPA